MTLIFAINLKFVYYLEVVLFMMYLLKMIGERLS
jgi:hypothetical protein